MPGPLVADEATTVAMITAFDKCSDACDAIQASIEAASSALFVRWHGIAARKYREAIAGWQAGFEEVRSGLSQLNDSMVTYARLTKTTEDNALMLGSSWAEGGELNLAPTQPGAAPERGYYRVAERHVAGAGSVPASPEQAQSFVRERQPVADAGSGAPWSAPSSSVMPTTPGIPAAYDPATATYDSGNVSYDRSYDPGAVAYDPGTVTYDRGTPLAPGQAQATWNPDEMPAYRLADLPTYPAT
jgi:uncharacterized protein YukE